MLIPQTTTAGGAPSSSEDCNFTVTFPGFLIDRVIDAVTNQLNKHQEEATQRSDKSGRTTPTDHDEDTTPPEHNRGHDDATD